VALSGRLRAVRLLGGQPLPLPSKTLRQVGQTDRQTPSVPTPLPRLEASAASPPPRRSRAGGGASGEGGASRAPAPSREGGVGWPGSAHVIRSVPAPCPLRHVVSSFPGARRRLRAAVWPGLGTGGSPLPSGRYRLVRRDPPPPFSGGRGASSGRRLRGRCPGGGGPSAERSPLARRRGVRGRSPRRRPSSAGSRAFARCLPACGEREGSPGRRAPPLPAVA